MTIHATVQYLKYKWKAKGRHGIHSPFVYAFIEDVVQNRKKIPGNDQIELPGLPPYYARLAGRIIQYYQYKNIKSLPAESDSMAGCDMLVFPENEPLLWASLVNKYFHLLKSDAVIFVLNIHKTVAHTHEWNGLCSRQDMLMSIDLYGIGLLFFKKEFKEKQHFVLKY